jgi:hypothetical protein
MLKIDKSAPIYKIMEGYNEVEKQTLDNGTKNAATKEGDTTNFAGEHIEHRLSPLEKIARGLDKGSNFKDFEIDVNKLQADKADRRHG